MRQHGPVLCDPSTSCPWRETHSMALPYDDIICTAISRAPSEFLTRLLELRPLFPALAGHLLLAARRGRPEIIRLLLSRSRPPKHHLVTMFCVAIRHGHHEAAELIMKMVTPPVPSADWESTTFEQSSAEPTKFALGNPAFEVHYNTLCRYLGPRKSKSDPADHALI